MTRVLVVEDDEALRRLIQDDLGRRGLAVTTAGSIAQARILIHTEDFDVVVLDRRLPDGSGLDLLVDVTDFMSVAHVIVVSGESRETERVRALEAGADDYMVKPFSVPELAARIDAMSVSYTHLTLPTILRV